MVNFQRIEKNLFIATTRESKELTKNKIIYDDNQTKIQVNRSLHQRHRDLLSIIFSYLDLESSFTIKEEKFYIYTSLYNLAKKMNYAPKQAVKNIKKFLDDFQDTLIISSKKNGNNKIDSVPFIYKHYYDENLNKYVIIIPKEIKEIFEVFYPEAIPKEINQKIIELPNKYAKTKALVSYILSNKTLKNSISFEKICDILDIKAKVRQSEFKREIKLNKQILEEFNIVFDEETKIIKYEKISIDEEFNEEFFIKLDKFIKIGLKNVK